MAKVLGQVFIPHKNSLTSDGIVNTFNFNGIDDLEDMGSAILGRLNEFYSDSVGSPDKAVTQYMSDELAITSARLKLYDFDDPQPRVPFLDESLGLTQGSLSGGWPLPGEVAIACSYGAETISGGNVRRRRGRIFIGPLNANAITQTTATPARPSGDCVLTLRAACLRLAEANTLGCQWSVYSRAASQFYEVVRGHVDNALDTQRRRGVAPTSRSTWEVEV